MNRPVLAVLLLLSLAASPALAGGVADILVTTTEDGVDSNPGDGICNNGSGACTLRAAIQTANAVAGPHRVVLGEGIYALTIKRDTDLADAVTGDLDVTSDITVVGEGGQGECDDGVGCTAIDGKGGKDRVFDIAQGVGVLWMSDVFVRNGKAAKTDLNPTQKDEVSGGCIRNDWGLNLDRVVVENCKSPDDGGCIGFNGAGTNGLLQDTFLNRCKAKDAGGAIEVDTGSLLLNRVTIANSKAAQGGGIETSGGQLDLRNVTFSHNKARQGGGIEAEDEASVGVYSTSFVSNKASEGAAIAADQFQAVTLHNSLFDSGGKENNCAGAVASQGGNLENNLTCNLVQPSDCDDCDPGTIETLADNGGPIPTHAVESNGEGINRGVATCETTDARGAPRVGACDSGSFEFNGVVP